MLNLDFDFPIPPYQRKQKPMLTHQSFITQVLQVIANVLALLTYGISDSRTPYKRGLTEFFEFLGDIPRWEFILAMMNDIESKLILMLETAKTNESRFYEVKNQLAVAQACVHSFADQEKVFDYILKSDEYQYAKNNTSTKIGMIMFIRAATGCGFADAKNLYEADMNKNPVALKEGV